MRSKSLICPSCSSQIDLTGQQGAQIVGKVGSRPRPRYLQLQPGMKCTLEGQERMIIGRVVYRGDEGDVWDEWLLLSAAGEYSWISDSEEGIAHWHPFTPTQPIDPNTIREGGSINLRGQPCRVRDRGEAKITYLEGELTWKARLGDTMQYAEAEGATERLSLEWTPEEIEFYYGQRLNRIEVAKAFGLATQGVTGKGGKGGCANTAIVIVVIVVFMVFCIAMAALPSTGSSGTGISIRSGSSGRTFSGGGGSSGGGK
jgi:hypothetical protein